MVFLTNHKRLGLLFALALVASAGCTTLDGPRRDWVRVRTQHFEIVSASALEPTLNLAEDLGVFREVALRFTTMQMVEPRVPTVVYIVDRKLWGELNCTEFTGLFTPGTRENVLIMVQGGSLNQQRTTLLHEYAHFLMGNQQSANYPIWFTEGWAELLSTIRLWNDNVFIGQIAPWRSRALQAKQWIPTAELISMRRYPSGLHGREMFYAQSLALVHFLQFGRSERKQFVPQLADYVKRLEAGETAPEAFERAFGWSPRQIERRLRSYVGGLEKIPSFIVPVEKFGELGAPRVDPIGKAELATRLGWLLVYRAESKRALRYFEAALRADPDFARAYSGLGFASAGMGKWEEAGLLLQRGVEIAPDDPLSYLDLANAFQLRAVQDAEGRKRWLEQARDHYHAALRLGPELPETHAQLGASYLVEGEDPALGIDSLGRAHALLPADLGIRLNLAMAYARLGRREEARAMLAPVIAFTHRGPMLEAAEALLKEVSEVAVEN